MQSLGNSIRMKRYGFVTALVSVVLAAWWMPTSAATICYSVEHYPAVGALQVTDEGLRATLAGRGTLAGGLRPSNDESPNSNERNHPVLIYRDEEGWQSSGTRRCSRPGACLRSSVQSCSLPEIPLTERERQFVPGRPRTEETRGVCAEHDGRQYFGLSFYSGEGVSGLGGWGWLDEEGEPVLRRAPPLYMTSVNSIAHDGENLWLGTADNHECMGEEPSEGLLMVDLDSHWVYPRDVSDKTCGFVQYDMVMHEDDLWISSDMGLTRVIKPAEEGRSAQTVHFAPTGDPEQPMEETDCDSLYRNLVNNMQREPAMRLYRQYETFLRILLERRPGFAHDYVDPRDQETDDTSSSSEEVDSRSDVR